jgi:hypothetical protein
VIAYATAQPLAATAMVLFALCALVGLVDRVTEPWRLRARARADYARAMMLRERGPSRLAPGELQPPQPGTVGADVARFLAEEGARQHQQARRVSRWGKGS